MKNPHNYKIPMTELKELVDISGYFLESDGWVKNGFVWTNGGNVLTYDGSVWVLNGEEVKYTYEIENKLK